MDQSKSNNKPKEEEKLKPPARTFTLEFVVGIFAILGCGAASYLSVGLGGLNLGPSRRYDIIAEFDNISGLEKGASIEIAGVQIGEVTGIYLNDPAARVVMSIDNEIKIADDDIASIRTKGIIGDRFIKISRGASDKMIAPGGLMMETESVVDIEDIIGKIVHNLSGDDEESDEKKSEVK